jgi:solute carrier family 35, member F1/2
MIIMGVQCAIFERESLENTQWSGAIAGYLVGYTLTLFILYSFAPILFRMSSAMFYNLSLLTSGNLYFSLLLT